MCVSAYQGWSDPHLYPSSQPSDTLSYLIYLKKVDQQRENRGQFRRYVETRFAAHVTALIVGWGVGG